MALPASKSPASYSFTASVSICLLNAGSPRARFMMVVLIFRFSLLIFCPEHLGDLDILILGLLCPAAKQDDQFVTLLTEVDPVTWSEVDLIFRHTFSDGLHVGNSALFQ